MVTMDDIRVGTDTIAPRYSGTWRATDLENLLMVTSFLKYTVLLNLKLVTKSVRLLLQGLSFDTQI